MLLVPSRSGHLAAAYLGRVCWWPAGGQVALGSGVTCRSVDDLACIAGPVETLLRLNRATWRISDSCAIEGGNRWRAPEAAGRRHRPPLGVPPSLGEHAPHPALHAPLLPPVLCTAAGSWRPPEHAALPASAPRRPTQSHRPSPAQHRAYVRERAEDQPRYLPVPARPCRAGPSRHLSDQVRAPTVLPAELPCPRRFSGPDQRSLASVAPPSRHDQLVVSQAERPNRVTQNARNRP